MKLRKFVAMVACSVCTLCVFAQEAAQEVKTEIAQVEDTAQSVEINATKNPDWKSYANMLKGLDAFEKHHALAPQAEARFILKPRAPEFSMQGLSLRLADDEHSIVIPIAADGTFVLPRDAQAEKEKAELLINRKKAQFRWWPRVRSPNLAEHQRRLGDLRLECEMFWAIEYEGVPFIARNLVRMMGGPCKTKKVRIYSPSDFTGLKSATLVEGEHRLALMLGKEKANFHVPLFDQSFSDNAMIELKYVEDATVRKPNYMGMFVQVAL